MAGLKSGFKQNTPYAWCVVAILCLASILGWVDRQIINLLVGPIKETLGINDTQVGLLQGLSFALLYVVASLPIAWMADTGKRTLIISIGIICWSLATFFCGLATSFLIMFLARMMVGLGEATLAPSGYSLLSDYFSKDRVGIAISLFTGCGFLGAGLGYIIGGKIIGYFSQTEHYTLPIIGQVEPWQITFMVVAAPGLILLLLMQFVKEPPRQSILKTPERPKDILSSFKTLFAYILTNKRLFFGLFVGLSIMAAATLSINNWIPEYFIRQYGLTPQKASAMLGPIIMITSPGAVFIGGLLASLLMKRGIGHANLSLAITSVLLAACFAYLFTKVETLDMAIKFLIPTLFFGALPFGCGTATLPLVAPNRLRAQIVAVYLLIANLLGNTIGPAGVGLVTDYIFKDPSRLGDSISVVAPLLYLTGALIALMAVKPYDQIIRKDPSIA